MEIFDYKYTARNSNGKIIKGKMEAPNKSIIETFLSERNLSAMTIVKVKSYIGMLNRITFGKVISPRDLLFYLKQLYSLLKASVSIDEASMIMANQQENPQIRRILYAIYYELNNGSSLSETYKLFPLEFPQMMISMIEIGEATGGLLDVVNDLTNYYEKQFRLNGQLKSIIMMPIIYLVVASGVAAFLLIGVLPMFEEIYAQLGSKLPTITQVFLNFGDFMASYWYYIIGIVVLLVLMHKSLKSKNEKYQEILSTIAIRMPLFGSVTKLNNLSRIASSLAQLQGNFVPLQDSLVITHDILANKIYRSIIIQAQENVKNGEGLSLAFIGHWAVDPVFSKMITIGERTGEIPSMLKNLASFYDEDSDLKVEQIKSAMEPILMLVVYGVVIVMILAVMMPSLSLSNSL